MCITSRQNPAAQPLMLRMFNRKAHHRAGNALLPMRFVYPDVADPGERHLVGNHAQIASLGIGSICANQQGTACGRPLYTFPADLRRPVRGRQPAVNAGEIDPAGIIIQLIPVVRSLQWKRSTGPAEPARRQAAAEQAAGAEAALNRRAKHVETFGSDRVRSAGG